MALFTPYANGFMKPTLDEGRLEAERRCEMDLSDEDRAKIGRGGPWRAVVTDRNTGIKWKVQGADCGSGGCFCAAEIVGRVTELAPLPKTPEEQFMDEIAEAHERGECKTHCWVCDEDASNPVYTGEQARELLSEAAQIIRKVRYNRIAEHINGSPLEHAVSDINAAILDLEEYK